MRFDDPQDSTCSCDSLATYSACENLPNFHLVSDLTRPGKRPSFLTSSSLLFPTVYYQQGSTDIITAFDNLPVYTGSLPKQASSLGSFKEKWFSNIYSISRDSQKHHEQLAVISTTLQMKTILLYTEPT